MVTVVDFKCFTNNYRTYIFGDENICLISASIVNGYFKVCLIFIYDGFDFDLVINLFKLSISIGSCNNSVKIYYGQYPPF